jgi:predicted MFS family arabinose efflux permease
VEPLNHFTIIGTVVGLLTVFTLRFLVNTSPVAPTGQSFTVKTNRTLLNLAIIAFCVLLGEGAMADWSAVYLNQNAPDDPGLAPLGYAAFSLAMAVGRLNGDWLIARLSPARMLRISGLLAAAGLAFALSFNFPVTVLLGFACVGFGFSTVVPIVFSAAGRTPRMPSSTALATVTTLGYFGFLAGPPIIGWGAGLLSLRGSLAVVILLSLMIALLAPSVERKEAE